MNTEASINDLGTNAIIGTEIMELLSLTPDDLNVPKRFKQLQEIIEYLGQYKNYRFIINSVTRNKNVDKLEHVYSYIQLCIEKQEKEKYKNDLDTKISTLSEDNPEYVSLKQIYDETCDDIEKLKSEMSFFEK